MLIPFDELKMSIHVQQECVGEIILGKKNLGMNYLLHIESNESKRIWYQRKIRIRKQSASPIKLIIQFKPLGMITINFCNITVHIYNLVCPDVSLQAARKILKASGCDFNRWRYQHQQMHVLFFGSRYKEKM
jgi:hypothetical protein